MLKTVHIITDPLDPMAVVTVETDNVCATCKQHFEVWPSTARIYHEIIAEDSDVTPHNELDIDNLLKLTGTFYIVVYPGDPVTIIVGLIINIVLSVAMYLLTPKPKTDAAQPKSPTQGSANNELAARQNIARLNGRIPDIFGQVRSTPDLIAVPYSVFENNIEVEYAYMCVGRGEHAVSDIKDATTLISDIESATVEVYAPFTSPLASSTPQLRIGDAITQPVVSVIKSTAINGQELRALNSSYISTDANSGSFSIIVANPNIVKLLPANENFIPLFSAGDTLIIDGTFTATLGSHMGFASDFSGSYVIDSVTATEIHLHDPASVSPGWNALIPSPGDEAFATDVGSGSTAPDPNVYTSQAHYVGPVTIDVPVTGKLVFNLIALNGLYTTYKDTQSFATVDINIGVTPIDQSGVPTGAEVVTSFTVTGSAVSRNSIGFTEQLNITAGSYSVRLWRNNSIIHKTDTVDVTEIKWRDFYIMSSIDSSIHDFGNVTTVYSRTLATSGALSIKERKLNMLATRKVAQIIDGSVSYTPVASARAVDIMLAACLDPYIGRRTISEIDVSGMYDTYQQIVAYFGSMNAGEFSYTFDNVDTSFEDIVAAIAGAVFCTAYRQGNVIKWSFEQETDDSVMLFNHRNKLPGSEERTVRFGTQDNQDGIEYQFISPVDDAMVTYYIPLDRSAVNAKKIESVGVRNNLQAYLHAWREYNRIKYQCVSTKFTATQEAAILVIQDRILVADNTRTGTFDGEITAQDGLTLTLSQNVELNYENCQIFLQYVDGTVGTIPITQIDVNKVVLASAPKYNLITDPAYYAKTTFQIAAVNSTREHAFLLTEKTWQSNFTAELTAINYDARYYAKDRDYYNGIIDLNAGI